MFKVLTPIAAALLLSGCFVNVGGASASANHHVEQTLQLEINSINRLRADTGAGTLTIIGEQGRDIISVEADIYTIEKDEYTLTLERSGDKAKLVADVSNWSGNSWNIGGNNRQRIDLIVKMPARLALELDDGSGSVKITGLSNNIEVEDGSGSLEIDGGNNINIDDGSGSLVVKNATGNVFIEDGSGSVTVKNTGGKVTIDDNSGGINIEGAGSLEIIDSGSGGVNIEGVLGSVEVDD
jgi:hypothetical protein